ncbi:triphosphoribosyl-dephospho-CoA synthase MdcB [Tardiphaga sp. 866_E4_N2_1]|uniref:triphosphoribosyl-dephospho-CoA synthase MdcB n=1 Tax=unclassified Tardiphaga TaxID=2631404 RepID=UPI003F211AEC
MTAVRAYELQQTQHSKAQTRYPTGAIGDNAARCLLLELETWPKPGLVSHVDNGSHNDMDADTFRRSAAAIKPYFQRLADAAAKGCDMGRLRIIGIEAEAAMLAATSGVNTHRGAIFGLGLLCAAAGARASGLVDPGLSLGAVVSTLWGSSIVGGPVMLHSHGSNVRRKFGAGGARVEAAQGFLSVYQVGLPALIRGLRAAPSDAQAARIEACFALIAAVEDTNILHRAGKDGLRFAHRSTRHFLDMGGVHRPDWRDHAQRIHEAFVARRLSPGGSADLLAMTLFVAAQEGVNQ